MNTPQHCPWNCKFREYKDVPQNIRTPHFQKMALTFLSSTMFSAWELSPSHPSTKEPHHHKSSSYWRVMRLSRSEGSCRPENRNKNHRPNTELGHRARNRRTRQLVAGNIELHWVWLVPEDHGGAALGGPTRRWSTGTTMEEGDAAQSCPKGLMTELHQQTQSRGGLWGPRWSCARETTAKKHPKLARMPGSRKIVGTQWFLPPLALGPAADLRPNKPA